MVLQEQAETRAMRKRARKLKERKPKKTPWELRRERYERENPPAPRVWWHVIRVSDYFYEANEHRSACRNVTFSIGGCYESKNQAAKARNQETNSHEHDEDHNRFCVRKRYAGESVFQLKQRMEMELYGKVISKYEYLERQNH